MRKPTYSQTPGAVRLPQAQRTEQTQAFVNAPQKVIAVPGVGPGAGSLPAASPVQTVTGQTSSDLTPATDSVLGVTLLSIAPATAGRPVAVGDNDPRNTNARTPSGSAGGDLTGSYPNPSLAAVGSAGTYGDSTHYPAITLDSKGRVTGVSLLSLPGGSVTSVGLSMPSWFTVSGSPVTSAGTLAVTANTQSANQALLSPNGSSGAPSFRALVPADYPVFVASGTSHAAGAVPDPGNTAGTTRFLREDATWAVPSGGGGG